MVNGLKTTPNSGGTGIRVLDSPGSMLHTAVSATIDQDCEITQIDGSGTGVKIEGTNASGVVQNNDASIHGFSIGVDVNGGTATITNNHIYNNGTGVRFVNGGNGNVNTNKFYDAIPNVKDIEILGDAGSVLASPNNWFAGSSYGVENLSVPVVDATLNYWNNASGPGPVGPGSGVKVSAKVDYCPWLNDVPVAFGGSPTTTYPTVNIIVTEMSGVFNNDGTICAGDQAKLDATTVGATSYLWSPGGETTPSIMVSPLTTTTYTVSVTFTDCIATDEQIITVGDNTPPVISTCPPQNNLFGCGTSAIVPAYSTSLIVSDLATFTNAGGIASDQCGITYYAYQDASVTGTCPKTVLRTWTVKDANNNAASCDQTITITDNTPPTGTAPTAIGGVNACLPTQSEANASFDATLAASGYTDGCGGAVTAELVSAVVSGSKCSWSTLYTFKVKDECGNALNGQSYTRSGSDQSAPTGSAPAAITGVNACLPAQSEADASFDAALAASGYTDGCGGAVTAELVSAVVSGNKCSWSILYTFKVKDECGNYLSNQSYTHSGGDQTAPTGTAPAAITGVNSCLPTQTQADAAFDATLAASGYSDHCGGTVTAEMVSAVISGTKCSWSVDYTFKVKDECGNYSNNQSYTRSGGDQTAPTGTAPAAITGVNSCLPTQAQADASFDATLAASGYSDHCGGTVTVELVSAVISGTKCNWTITYTFKAKDECGNYLNNQSYTRSGGDQTAPTGSAPAAITGVNSCLPTQSEADASFDAALAASGYTDGCGGVVTAELVSAVVSGSKCSWSILYTFKVKDECGNVLNGQSYKRSGSDQTAPTGSAPAAITGVNSCLPTQSEANASFDAVYAASGYTDGCGGVVTAELVSAVVSGSKCSWSILYTFKVKDECGNELSGQNYTRSGSDQSAPSGTAPVAITGVNACLPTQSEADASFDAVLAASGYSDGCGGVVTAELVSAVVSGSKCSWSILYTFKVKDECGNELTGQNYTRSGSDQSAPTGTAPALITGVNACLPTQGEADASFDAVIAASGYTDGCGGTVTAELVSAVVSGSKCSWSILYTFKVKDECGNELTGQNYIRSGSDQSAPTGTAPAAITGVNACLPTQSEADASFDAALAASGYSDGCGGVVTAELVSTNILSGSSNCNWSVNYAFKVKDECGNELTDRVT
ncbi:MAG: hypothetical protein U0T81_09990 [Saprospiraceae bacterium]